MRGGNLAAAISLKLRDIKMSPQPKLQVLIYPVTQALDFNLPSFIINENDPFLKKERMVAMWLLYAEGELTFLQMTSQFLVDLCAAATFSIGSQQ